MSKGNTLTGNNYRACPCAKILEKKTSGATYFGATCCSPKRGTPVMINNVEQNRICCGGQVNGQRYTGCPYYVRNAQIGGNRHTVVDKSGSMAGPLVWTGLCWIIAYALFKSGLEHAGVVGLVFVFLGFASLISGLRSKNEKTGTVNTDSNKKGRRR